MARHQRLLLTAVLLACGVAQSRAQEPAPDSALAERLFRTHCARCHGIDGRGGEGPSLHRPTLRATSRPGGLYGVIQGGIEGTGMPGSWWLSPQEIRQLVGWVESLGKAAAESEPPPGDPDRGREVYLDFGCEACHVLAGEGRAIGPELTRIGESRGFDYLRESLLDPNATVDDDYLFVRLRTKEGASIEGLRINEDAFTVQLRDANGDLHSFDKAQLEELRRLRGRSIMRSYRRQMSDDEIDDLVTYLGSLKGAGR